MQGYIGGKIGAAVGQITGAMIEGLRKLPEQSKQPESEVVGSDSSQTTKYPAGGYTPAGAKGATGNTSPDVDPIYNPPVPFEHRMGGIYPNKMICISGIPHPSASRFTVYLQHGNDDEPQNIGVCLDARFNYGNDHNVFVRNHKQGNWGQEEKHCPYFPFIPNGNFDMIISIEPHCFKVAVNNQHLLEFNHRIRELSCIDTLRIDGDVRLTQVRFEG